MKLKSNNKKTKRELLEYIAELELENELLKKEVAELRARLYGRKRKKEILEEDIKSVKKEKKRGARAGHAGWYRKKPKKIDEIKVVKLTSCPCCGSRSLTKCDKEERHVQEDIILPKVKVTLYLKPYYYCKECKKVVCGKGEGELPKSYLGPNAKASAIFMKYDIKISDRDIKKIFNNFLGLDITASSIAGFRNQLRREGYSLFKELQKELKKSPYIHADETGWRLNGEPQWIFSVSNHLISLFFITKGRGQKEVKEILGKKYNGILISDFLSAYNKIETKGKQKCLIHLIRELKKVMQRYSGDKIIFNWCKRLKEFFKEGIKLYKEYKNNKYSEKYFIKTRERIVKTLEDFTISNRFKEELPRLSKRIIRHKDELFTFLYNDNIDYHNNHAEQQIRPNVLLRKITFGNRSTKGVENHNVLMSIIQTAKLNKKNPLDILKNILITPDKKNIFPFIRSP